MSLHLARQTDQEHPHLLQTNIGATCYQYTLKLIEKLRAAGHEAYSMGKTHGEGQYIPPGFQPRTLAGLDGKPYVITGVSHDAIWCDGKQFDTAARANDGDEPIYENDEKRARGERLTALPVWHEIPEHLWRAKNPPLKDASPPPAPALKILPKGEAFAQLQALSAFYAAPEGLQRPGGLVRPNPVTGLLEADMEAIAQWFYQIVIEGVSLNDVFTQIKNSHEWKEKHPGER